MRGINHAHRNQARLRGCWNELRIEIIDQWYGADYRYVKVKDDVGGLYILRVDERSNEWALIMFVSARGRVLATQTA
jgi:hypothetical protein